jgi:hypothetical protein
MKSRKGRTTPTDQLKCLLTELVVYWGVLAAGLGGVGSLSSCGTVGPVIAPEDIGVAAKLQREQQAREQKGQEQPARPSPEAQPPETGAEPPKPEEVLIEGEMVQPSARPSGTVPMRPR